MEGGEGGRRGREEREGGEGGRRGRREEGGGRMRIFAIVNSL